MLLHLFDCCNEEWVTQKHKRRVRFVIKTSFSMVKKWAAEFIHGRASILCEVRSGSILCEVRSRRWQPLRTTIKSYDSPMQHSHEYIVASTWVSFIKQNKFTRSYAKFWFFFFFFRWTCDDYRPRSCHGGGLVSTTFIPLWKINVKTPPRPLQ